MSFKYSVIATTYNQPGDLDLYLRSLAAQTRDDFEIILADDGSSEETRAVFDRFRAANFGERIKHVWHEDLGYRKSKILNSAIRASSGQWLIFTDSDLIVHPRFVDDHVSQERSRSLFMGRRVDLNPDVSSWIRNNPESLFSTEFYLRVLKSGFQKIRSKNVQRSIRIGSPLLASLVKGDRVPDLLGSNFSICRDLLFRVNGFDEASEHYWGEDGDLFVRIRNSGATILGRKNFCVQWHLWHKQRSPQPTAEQSYRDKLVSHDYVVCKAGLNPL